jgi:hypothetical protein
VGDVGKLSFSYRSQTYCTRYIPGSEVGDVETLVFQRRYLKLKHQVVRNNVSACANSGITGTYWY